MQQIQIHTHTDLAYRHPHPHTPHALAMFAFIFFVAYFQLLLQPDAFCCCLCAAPAENVAGQCLLYLPPPQLGIFVRCSFLSFFPIKNIMNDTTHTHNRINNNSNNKTCNATCNQSEILGKLRALAWSLSSPSLPLPQWPQQFIFLTKNGN